MVTPGSHLNAYVVNQIGEGESARDQWIGVGIVYPLEKGQGYQIRIHDNISVTGNIVIPMQAQQTDEKNDVPC